MAHVEASQLSQQELAQLACSYAALILHDDGQDITSTSPFTQATSCPSSSRLPTSRSKTTGLSTSPRPSTARTSPPSSTSVVLAVPLPPPLLPLPPPAPLLQRRRWRKRRRSPSPLRRKKIWTWVTCSADRIHSTPSLIISRSTLYTRTLLYNNEFVLLHAPARAGHSWGLGLLRSHQLPDRKDVRNPRCSFHERYPSIDGKKADKFAYPTLITWVGCLCCSLYGVWVARRPSQPLNHIPTQ